MDPRQGDRSLRRAGRPGAACSGDHGQEPSEHGRLVHGTDPAHDRQRHRARLLPAATRARQRRSLRRRHQHLPRSRQRPGRDRCRPEPRLPARLLRHRAGLLGALGQGLERRPRLAEEALCVGCDDDQAGHHGQSLDRRCAGAQRSDRPGAEPAGGVLLGPRAQFADARAGNEEGHGRARPAGRGRSVPVGDRGDGGDAGRRRQGQPEPHRLPAARVHAVRDDGLLHRVQPVDPVAREGHRAPVRVAYGPRDHAALRAEVGLRRPVAGQAGRQAEHPDRPGGGRLGRAGDRGHPGQRDQPRHLDDRLHRARAPSG